MMEFDISETLTESLISPTANERKRVVITAVDLQQNPAN
jgi:hypothetical protein